MKGPRQGLLAFALGSFAFLGLGLLPAGAGPLDAHAALVWWTLWAVPVGVLAGAAVSPVRSALGAALGLLALLVLLASFGSREVPSVIGAALVLVGSLGLGVGLGALVGRAGALQAAGLSLCVALLLAGLPTGGGLFPTPPAVQRPALGSLLLDLSPLSWTLESAGVDWERHPAIYGPAGTDWFSGERRPFRGSLFGPLALLVGALAAVGGTAHRARTNRDPGALPLVR